MSETAWHRRRPGEFTTGPAAAEARTDDGEAVVLFGDLSVPVEATEAGGARVRVLSITTTPAISSRSIAKRLEAKITANHGHLAPRLAARALELGPALRERYRTALVQLAGEAPEADTRLLSTAAALHVAHGVLRELGLPEPQCDWPAAIRGALGEAVVEADQAGRALDAVREEISASLALYRIQVDDRPPSSGRWRGTARGQDDFIGIYPEVLKEVLRRAGHVDLRPILARWKEDGVIRCNLGHRYEFGVSAEWSPSRKERVYAFNLKAL